MACLLANVLACQRGLHANVLACQRAKSVSTSHFLPASVLSGLSIFQIGVPTCLRACQFFKHSSYEMIREISILYCYIEKFYIIPDTIVIHKNYLVLHFYTSCHIKEKCVEFFFFVIFFSSLVRNGNIKRPGFYKVESKERSFHRFTSNFPNRNFFWQKLNVEPSY